MTIGRAGDWRYGGRPIALQRHQKRPRTIRGFFYGHAVGPSHLARALGAAPLSADCVNGGGAPVNIDVANMAPAASAMPCGRFAAAQPRGAPEHLNAPPRVPGAVWWVFPVGGEGRPSPGRARLGPRLTCALHRVILMRLHRWLEAATSKARQGRRSLGGPMQIYALSHCNGGSPCLHWPSTAWLNSARGQKRYVRRRGCTRGALASTSMRKPQRRQQIAPVQ